MQHGSLPLSNRHKELTNFIAAQNAEAFAELQQEMERKTTSLYDILGYIPPYSTLVAAMLKALQAMHKIDVVAVSKDEVFL